MFYVHDQSRFLLLQVFNLFDLALVVSIKL